jgi:pimeloyl-ACP methyl ester carboxylesterase
MRTLVIVLIVLLVVIIGATGATLAFTAPTPPPPMKSVETAFVGADFSGMPERSHFTARDGTRLDYRAYPGDPNIVVVLVHGSSGTSASMHFVAKAIHERGATVYALAMRGHDGTGRYGDVDYIGQLDDDVVDFVKTLPPKPAGGKRMLLGFSSGGGFVLRFAGSPNGPLFDRFILVSPQMPARSPLMRPNGGGWVSVSIPRFILLSALDRMGVHVFDGLTAIEFAVAPENRRVQTTSYTYRMLRNFGPTDDYLGDLKRAPGPVIVLAGQKDEIFHTDRYAAVLKPARADVSVTLIPELGHMDMTTKPAALAAISDAVYAR